MKGSTHLLKSAELFLNGFLFGWLKYSNKMLLVSSMLSTDKTPCIELLIINHLIKVVWFDLVSLFNGISIFIGYLMSKLSL